MHVHRHVPVGFVTGIAHVFKLAGQQPWQRCIFDDDVHIIFTPHIHIFPTQKYAPDNMCLCTDAWVILAHDR